jgi:hypothetical protein
MAVRMFIASLLLIGAFLSPVKSGDDENKSDINSSDLRETPYK